MPASAGMLPGDRDGRGLPTQGGGTRHGSLPETAAGYPDPHRGCFQRTRQLCAATDSLQHSAAVTAPARLIAALWPWSAGRAADGAYNRGLCAMAFLSCAPHSAGRHPAEHLQVHEARMETEQFESLMMYALVGGLMVFMFFKIGRA